MARMLAEHWAAISLTERTQPWRGPQPFATGRDGSGSQDTHAIVGAISTKPRVADDAVEPAVASAYCSSVALTMLMNADSRRTGAADMKGPTLCWRRTETSATARMSCHVAPEIAQGAP